MEAMRSSETPVLTRNRRRHIPENGILKGNVSSDALAVPMRCVNRKFVTVFTRAWQWTLSSPLPFTCAPLNRFLGFPNKNVREFLIFLMHNVCPASLIAFGKKHQSKT
jgi:hypothetical protein